MGQKSVKKKPSRHKKKRKLSKEQLANLLEARKGFASKNADLSSQQGKCDNNTII